MGKQKEGEGKVLSGPNQLVLGAQAPGTQLKLYLTTVSHNGDRMYIRFPVPLGVPLGMADIVTKLGCFAA